MMPFGNLARMVVANTVRSRRHFILSVFGIVIGITTFNVFLASTEKVGAVLEKIFPVEQVKVIAPHASLLGKDISKKLDDSVVSTIKTRSEVAGALPRMALAFPAFGRGDFDGNDLRFEVGGFADGIEASFVNDDARIRAMFKDWDADTNDKNRVACVPPTHSLEEVIQSPGAPPDPKEQKQAPPPTTDGWGNPIPGSDAPPPAPAPTPAPTEEPKDPKPKKYYNPCPHPDEYYCDESDRTCHHRVPVVMSPTMIELYNSQFAKSHGLPIADQDFVKFMTERGGLSAMRFSIGLGLTTIAGTNTAIQHKPRRVEAVLVGISDHAMPIGMTAPIPYIQRWNREFLGEEAATSYSSIVVTLKDRNDQAVFDQWLEEDLDLRIEDSLGEKFATVVFVVRIVLVSISFIIIAISAINISHNFFMQVTERRREIGLLRAIGASRGDVRMIVLGEALLIGLIGGALGNLLGFGISLVVDWASAHYLPNFPYKPPTWFEFRWWIISMALGFAGGFAVLGGFLPARKASNMEPAQALTQN